MLSGIVPLAKLIAFVEKDRTGGALLGTSASGRAYGKLTADLAGQIADAQGFYLWGNYGPNGLWSNIYLGKAGYGKTAHLRARIREELKDERVFLWKRQMSDEELLVIGSRIHRPERWAEYRRHWERSLRKAGATYIAWVACEGLSSGAVRNVEADLVETLNPSANEQRPAPPSALQQLTKEIIGEFRRLVHESRPLKGPPSSLTEGIPMGTW